MLEVINVPLHDTDNGDTIHALQGVTLYKGELIEAETAGWTVLIRTDRPLQRTGDYDNILEEEELSIVDAIDRHPELPFVRSKTPNRDYSPTGEWCWSQPSVIEYTHRGETTVQVTQRAFLDC